MITIGYDFRIQPDPSQPGGTLPQPTQPNFYPGLWHLLSADWLFSAQPGLSARMPGFVDLFKPRPEDAPAAHRMLCLDLEQVAEPFQRPIALAFLKELRRVTQAKCLIIGGCWPGHGPSKEWNEPKVMEQLRQYAKATSFINSGGDWNTAKVLADSNGMAPLLIEQLELYKIAGAFTYYIGADKPDGLDLALEKTKLMGSFLGDAAPGLERCIWLSGHYGPGGNNAEWTPDECVRVCDAAWDRWDSVAVHHGLTVSNNLANEISRRLA